MTLYTSLSPSPSAAPVQRACVQSWLDHGHRVVAVQGYGEDVSESLPVGVNVVQVKPTMAGHPAKPYVGLDAIL